MSTTREVQRQQHIRTLVGPRGEHRGDISGLYWYKWYLQGLVSVTLTIAEVVWLVSQPRQLWLVTTRRTAGVQVDAVYSWTVRKTPPYPAHPPAR